jgi:hypothetical protein
VQGKWSQANVAAFSLEDEREEEGRGDNKRGEERRGAAEVAMVMVLRMVGGGWMRIDCGG